MQTLATLYDQPDKSCNAQSPVPTLWMRARFAMLEWLCPKCRKLNLSRVGYDTGYLVRCKGRLCKAEWVIGHTLRPYHIKGIHPAWPSDLVLRPEWCEGEPVNEILPSQVDGNDQVDANGGG